MDRHTAYRAKLKADPEKWRHHLERQRENARRKRDAERGVETIPYWPIDELVIEIELLKGTDHPASISRRLGFDKPSSLHRRLCRHGYRELARMFNLSESDAA